MKIKHILIIFGLLGGAYLAYELLYGLQGAFLTYSTFATQMYNRNYTGAIGLTTKSPSVQGNFQAARQFYDKNMARFLEQPFYPRHKLEYKEYSKDRKKITLTILQTTIMKITMATMTEEERNRGVADKQLKNPKYRHKATLVRTSSGWKVDSFSFSEVSGSPFRPPAVKKPNQGGLLDDIKMLMGSKAITK